MSRHYRAGGLTIIVPINIISHTLRDYLKDKQIKHINLTERSQSMGVEICLKDGTKYVWNQGSG